MSFTSLINLRNCQVKRKTDVLLEKKIITLNPLKTRDPPPGQPGCMEVHISGYPSGPLAALPQVTISGLDASGAPILPPVGEVFSFTENEVVVGEEEFQTITAISTLWFLPPVQVVAGDIEIRLVTPSGAPIYQEIPIFDEMPCWLDFHRGGVSVVIPGGVITGITKLFCKHNPAKPLAENDLIYYDGHKYRIDFIEWCASKAKKIHHLELILKKAKTNED